MMKENCRTCNEKREWGVQIGTDESIIFCNICGQIIAKGLDILEKSGQIKITFGGNEK